MTWPDEIAAARRGLRAVAWCSQRGVVSDLEHTRDLAVEGLQALDRIEKQFIALGHDSEPEFLKCEPLCPIAECDCGHQDSAVLGEVAKAARALEQSLSVMESLNHHNEVRALRALLVRVEEQ